MLKYLVNDRDQRRMLRTILSRTWLAEKSLRTHIGHLGNWATIAKIHSQEQKPEDIRVKTGLPKTRKRKNILSYLYLFSLSEPVHDGLRFILLVKRSRTQHGILLLYNPPKVCFIITNLFSFSTQWYSDII